MKRKPILSFFDISSNIEELPENELFRLKGGFSDDTEQGGYLETADVYPEDGESDENDDQDEDLPPWEEDDPYDDEDEYDDDMWDDDYDPTNDDSGNNNSTDSDTQGDPVQELLNKVNFDPDITEEFKANFKAALESIKGTEIGKLLLSKLAAKTGAITVTNNAEHSVQGNTLNAGMFDYTSETFFGEYQKLSLGHELFHLMQNAEYGTTKTEISYEVEARLFEYELARAFDDMENFLRNFADDAYRDAFIDFAEGNNNSIDDFNALIDGFKDGTNGGGVYDGYDETHINSWDDIIWDNIGNN